MRYTYKGALAQPLKPDQTPASKISALLSDLGAPNVHEAVLLLACRHISGFQRSGPKSRSYPSGPLRSHLKPNEQSQDRLPLLYSYLGVSADEDALLALAVRHVPGFRYASPFRNGGRKRVSQNDGQLTDVEADGDEAFLIEIIDMLREANPGKKLVAIAHELSIDKPAAGCENPAFGKDPNWIVQRYTNRRRYDRASDRRFGRVVRKLRARLRGGAP
jgi:hypothetical protein